MCRLEDDHAHLKQEKEKGDEIVVKGDHEVEINNTKEFCAGVDCLPLSCVGYESRYCIPFSLLLDVLWVAK